MNCVFPLIKKAIEEGNITVDDIAKKCWRRCCDYKGKAMR